MSRLTIEIEPEQHRQIKTLATFAGMSIKDFILTQTLESQPQKETKQNTTAKLLGSKNNATRLRRALATPATKHRVFKNVEDLKNALGI